MKEAEENQSLACLRTKAHPQDGPRCPGRRHASAPARHASAPTCLGRRHDSAQAPYDTAPTRLGRRHDNAPTRYDSAPARPGRRHDNAPTRYSSAPARLWRRHDSRHDSAPTRLQRPESLARSVPKRLQHLRQRHRPHQLAICWQLVVTVQATAGRAQTQHEVNCCAEAECSAQRNQQRQNGPYGERHTSAERPLCPSEGSSHRKLYTMLHDEFMESIKRIAREKGVVERLSAEVILASKQEHQLGIRSSCRALSQRVVASVASRVVL